MARYRTAVFVALATIFHANVGVGAELQVPAGCDKPSQASEGRKFYVDPVHGASTNDGSAARPWKTLSEVLDPRNHLVSSRAYTRTPTGLGPLAPVNPNGPIKPGDTIVLMSGDHGVVATRNNANENFMFVSAYAR